jgi:hypothetical protein
MTEFDVSPFEMDDNSLSETDIEAVLASDQTAGPDALHDLFSGLRERFETSTDVPVGTALAEFIDVVDLTTTSAHTEPRRNRKMITGIGTLIATTTGKIVLGTTVAAASMGAAHAADMVEIPGLPETSAEVIIVDHAKDSEDKTEETVPTEALNESSATEDEDNKEDGTKEDVIKEEAIEKSDGEDSEDEGTEDEDTEHRNHGQMISKFATSTKLEGCEKGQAISELASSKHDDEDQDESDDDEYEDDSGDDESDDDDDDSKDHPCEGDDFDHEGEDEDSDHEDEDEDHEDSDHEDEDHDEEHRGNGKAKGKNNKPDHDDDDDES